MKRVLLIHPHLRPHGGGQTVAAWALQALRDRYDLSLLTWERVDYDGVNRTFGTTLHPGDFQVHLPPVAVRVLAGALPGRRALMETSVMMRQMKKLDRIHPYDVILGTHDEMDFGRRGIQYVHYPHHYLPPLATEYRWYHRLPGMLAFYRRACQRISAVTPDGLRRNVTLVNSRFIGARVEQVYGIRSVVVHPPVSGGFPNIAWEDRTDAFACVGRLAPVKQLTDAVEIIEGLRARGHALRLHIIGMPEDPRYETHLRALARTRADWMELHTNLPRAEMTALVARQRYGLHAQVGEPFGIAAAELVRAGCLTFVASPGGPVEIVGDEPNLMFSSPADAVETIDRVLRDPHLLDRLRTHLADREGLFTAERFMREIRQAVDEFEA